MKGRSKKQRLSVVGPPTAGRESASTAEPAEELTALEQEHRLLTDLRQRLHEAIGLLEGIETVKPDAAARLERYRRTEQDVSRRRGDLERQIRSLHAYGGERS